MYGGSKDPFMTSANDLKLKYPKGAAPTPGLAEILTFILPQIVEDFDDSTVVEETDLVYRVVSILRVLLALYLPYNV